MEIPTVEEFCDMDIEEIREVIEIAETDEKVDEIEVKQRVKRVVAKIHQRGSIQKPKLFAKNARVNIKYIVGDEEIVPVTSGGGSVLFASESELILHDEIHEPGVKNAVYQVDLENLTVHASPGAGRDTPHSGDLVQVKLISPPWDSEFDAGNGIVTPMIHSPHNWVQEGVYLYPPDEFLSEV